MKSLNKYRNLIAEMPVDEQAFTTKKSTWESKVEKHILDRLFDGRENLTISRANLFSKCPIDDFIHLVVFWGYPRGMRGHRNESKIFQEIPRLSELLNNSLRGKQTEESLSGLLTELNKVSGLGISTISKLLYFRTHRFGFYSALILDERIMRVFQNQLFKEFEELKQISRVNAYSKYIDYLKVMHLIAMQLDVAPDNLEMFLFTFGNNLK